LLLKIDLDYAFLDLPKIFQRKLLMILKKITLLSSSSIDKDIKGGEKISKTEISKKVAFNLAKKAQEKKITRIFFDRGIYRYHGRVKVFAETLRENGMEF
jgi:large subunit ribosomal protein L18